VALLVQVLPLDKGISSGGIPDRILDLGKQFDADIGVASFRPDHGAKDRAGRIGRISRRNPQGTSERVVSPKSGASGSDPQSR
jgi:hypothetical protein